MTTVFVSHSHYDDAFGLKLMGDLKHQLGDAAVWYDASGGLHGGDEWWRTIVTEIEQRDIFVVILSPEAMASDWVPREMSIGYYQHAKNRKVLLPVLLMPCTLSTDWQLIHAIDFTVYGRTGDGAQYTGGLQVLLSEIARAMPQPTTPARPVPTLIVDQMHRGDHTTISAAIAAAQPGTRILVRPGVYIESLAIDKPLEIVGDGPRDDILVQCVDNSVIWFKTTAGRIANLTLRQLGGNYCCIYINQGRLDVEDCDISSQGLASVEILNVGTFPRIRRNRIHNGKQSGIYVRDQGQGLIEDNDIFANAFVGISITKYASPTLRRNNIHNNQEAGIDVIGQGQGVIEDNDIFANGYNGIQARSGGNPIVRHNRISRNMSPAIGIWDGGSGTYEDNDLRDSPKGAWEIRTNAGQITRARNSE